MPVSKQLFPIGLVVATPSALKKLEAQGMDVSQLITRHVTGDDGDLSVNDKQANLDALQHGDRIFSSYKLSSDIKLYVITEADRSSTTILCAEEY